jgi:hypothetical protein
MVKANFSNLELAPNVHRQTPISSVVIAAERISRHTV